MSGASVKVMRSYDYCHFEICLSSDEVLSLDAVDSMRKDAARLVDKAVDQYVLKKRDVTDRFEQGDGLPSLERRVAALKENFPSSEWTPKQKANVKALEDLQFRQSREYDYQDDWEF